MKGGYVSKKNGLCLDPNFQGFIDDNDNTFSLFDEKQRLKLLNGEYLVGRKNLKLHGFYWLSKEKIAKKCENSIHFDGLGLVFRTNRRIIILSDPASGIDLSIPYKPAVAAHINNMVSIAKEGYLKFASISLDDIKKVKGTISGNVWLDAKNDSGDCLGMNFSPKREAESFLMGLMPGKKSSAGNHELTDKKIAKQVGDEDALNIFIPFSPQNNPSYCGKCAKITHGKECPACKISPSTYTEKDRSVPGKTWAWVCVWAFCIAALIGIMIFRGFDLIFSLALLSLIIFLWRFLGKISFVRHHGYICCARCNSPVSPRAAHCVYCGHRISWI